MKSITTQELFKKLRSKDHFILVDVRWTDEWNSGHIPSATHVPIDQFEKNVSHWKGKTVIPYCQSGGRSSLACKILEKNHIDHFNLKGGVAQWKKEGLPLESIN
ncbi:rhodanese-like domain-containing protein [Candidatus Peregrinibacteria bacterium]|nr:MAG: rhodanese-like domain-containing protein [Candidatus Peregrinibacteria bacterium]